MKTPSFAGCLRRALPGISASLFLLSCACLHAAPWRPNIVFILADDLGYGELGCYGQKVIQTPNIDRMAAEGMRFTQFYAGSTVCAPSRSVFMTGQHTGHTRVRGNAGDRPGAQRLTAQDRSIGLVMHAGGYLTGMFGKWSLGYHDDEGAPRLHGWDTFYGFLNQTHAHNHYSDFVWSNETRVDLPNVVTHVGPTGAGYATKRVVYVPDLLAEEALDFVVAHQKESFFVYWPTTLPHANNERARALGDGQEVPDYGPYADRDWPSPLKGQAAMITRLDAQVGTLLQKLRELGLAENTLVIFTSDNGPHNEGGPTYDPDFFDANGPLTGLKRSLREGGIREPFIAWWPGHVPAGRTSPQIGWFADMLPTFAALGGGVVPPGVDGIDLSPVLLGRVDHLEPPHPDLYWEFYEGGHAQAALLDGRWKILREPDIDAAIRVFDLRYDPAESHDLAPVMPGMVARGAAFLRSSHVDNEYWTIPGL